MTIKQDMEGEARKLATTVRDALAAFAKQTGMQADISVNWVTYQMLEEDASNIVVGEVRVDIGGMSVSA